MNRPEANPADRRGNRVVRRVGRVGGSIAGAAILAGSVMGLTGCDDVARATTPTGGVPTTEAPLSPSASATETEQAKPLYEQMIENINPADYVVKADPADTPEQIAQKLADRQEAMQAIMLSPDLGEAYDEWARTEFDKGNNPTEEAFAELYSSAVMDKLSSVYYAESVPVDTEADTGGIDELKQFSKAEGAINLIALYLTGKPLEKTVTTSNAVREDLPDGTFISSWTQVSTLNTKELWPDDSSKWLDPKTEDYASHVIIEDGEYRVISTWYEKISE